MRHSGDRLIEQIAAEEGEVFVHSERWTATASTPVRKDQAVEVTGLDGLILTVRPVPDDSEEHEDV